MAYNANLQQLALGLAERHWLGLYRTGAADHWRSPAMKWVRGSALARAVDADRRLSRRRIPDVPGDRIQTAWFWEVLQQFGRFVPRYGSFGDWCWEQSELSADRKAARLLRGDRFTGFIGTEHQSLVSLQMARQLGKPGVVIFTSPHHTAYEKWVTPEYQRYPALATALGGVIAGRSQHRNARRDAEMKLAAFTLCNSGFTARTLIDGGGDPQRMIAVPLGCPAVSELAPRSKAPRPVRFLHSGRLAVNKGGLYLLEAWRQFGRTPGVELHLCGEVKLPNSLLQNLPNNVHFHGHLSVNDLEAAYDQADCLVFPTLCDGFGLVVSEALARGVPVITTTNAGAADLIRPQENGLIVPPADTGRLVEAFDWVMTHRRDLPSMSEAAWQTARNWSWAHFRREVMRQFEEKITTAASGSQSEPVRH